MFLPPRKHALLFFVIPSILGHWVAFGIIDRFDTLQFAPPVATIPSVYVSLKEDETFRRVLQRDDDLLPSHGAGVVPGGEDVARKISPGSEDASSPGPVEREELSAAPVSDVPSPPAPPAASPRGDTYPSSRGPSVAAPLRKSSEFIATEREKLTYRISLYGVAVGNAELEARHENGEVRITTRVTSNPVLSGIYPVDDRIETRLVAGNYLITNVRQKEGRFASDMGFTLKMREKSVFWIDRLRQVYGSDSLPREDVMDLISGFYYLRNRPLEVNRPVELHLYDSIKYVPTTVEVLRKERVLLPNLKEVDTLVIHPLLKTDGFFRRTGDVLVWLTDDERKVPVRVETSIPLGTVTAELVSAEAEPATSRK
nr:DUF3108 domain-containing protein [Geobacter sp.]